MSRYCVLLMLVAVGGVGGVGGGWCTVPCIHVVILSVSWSSACASTVSELRLVAMSVPPVLMSVVVVVLLSYVRIA